MGRAEKTVHGEQRCRAKMERPRINYIPKGLNVDYEEEYSKYLMQEVSFEPRDNDDFTALLRLLERWHKKSIPQILEKNRPDAAYAIAMALCKHIPLLINRDDIQDLVGEYKRRIGKLIFDSYQALVEVVKAWNNEEKRRWVCDFIFKQTKYYHDFRGLQKVMLQMMPSQPYVGEPVAVVREKSDEGQEDGQRCQVGNDLAVGQHQYAVRTDIRVLIYLLSGLDERRCRR